MATDTIYGVFTVAHVRVALPLSELREVIPSPPSFETLLATAPGLVGAVNVRHQVIPVLDLRQILGIEAGESTDVVVVVSYEGLVFGLLACAVKGVVRLDEAAMLGMEVGALPQHGVSLFSRTFERPDDGSVVCVLDCAAIRSLPGMPLAQDTGGPTALGAGGFTAGTTMMMLLRCGPINVCVDVNDIHAVIPELTVRSSPLDGPEVHGVLQLGDRYVPIVDLLAILDLGQLPTVDAKRGVAFAYPRGLLTFAVTEVVRIVPAPESALLPLPTFGAPRSRYIVGILPDQEGGSYLVLDGAALRASEELDTLGALGTPVGGDAVSAEVRRSEHGNRDDDKRIVEPSVRKYLTYTAGLEVATPLTQISEIVPYPTDIIPFVDGGPVRGLFTHRRASVPLVHLPVLLGQGDGIDPETARILLVEAGDAYVGFAVPTLRAIEESVWEERASDEPPTGDPLKDSALVKIGTVDEGRMLPHIDLHRIVTSGVA